MKALSYAAIGTQLTILLSLVERIANTEFGINMDANYTILLHMTMLSQALSGLQMEITSQLAHSRCLDSVISLDGLTPSTSLNADLFLA